MGEALPPIHFYAVLGAAAGLLPAIKSMSPSLRNSSISLLFVAWLHIAGYIVIELYAVYAGCLLGSVAANLILHALILSAFVGVSLWSFYASARSAVEVNAEGATAEVERIREARHQTRPDNGTANSRG